MYQLAGQFFNYIFFDLIVIHALLRSPVIKTTAYENKRNEALSPINKSII